MNKYDFVKQVDEKKLRSCAFQTIKTSRMSFCSSRMYFNTPLDATSLLSTAIISGILVQALLLPTRRCF